MNLGLVEAIFRSLSKYLKYFKNVNVSYYVVATAGTNAQLEYSTG
jgi:hypothetical protein